MTTSLGTAFKLGALATMSRGWTVQYEIRRVKTLLCCWCGYDWYTEPGLGWAVLWWWLGRCERIKLTGRRRHHTCTLAVTTRITAWKIFCLQWKALSGNNAEPMSAYRILSFDKVKIRFPTNFIELICLLYCSICWSAQWRCPDICLSNDLAGPQVKRVYL